MEQSVIEKIQNVKVFLLLSFLVRSNWSPDWEAGGEKHWGDELLWAAVSHHRWPSAYWQGVLLHQGGTMWVGYTCDGLAHSFSFYKQFPWNAVQAENSLNTFRLLVKQVFKDMEFLGWYTTGGPPDQSDIHIHKQVGRSQSGSMYVECDEHPSHWNTFSLSGVWDYWEPALPQAQPNDQTHWCEFLSIFASGMRTNNTSMVYSNTAALICGCFNFQLPVSVYESVIDIINGEVLS